MSHPKIILPFGLPPAEHARDLIRLLSEKCGTDGLARLLSRSASRERQPHDDFAPLLPHEIWLSGQHDPLLQLTARLKLTLDPGFWFILTPVHLHIATNHLVLTDYRQLSLDDTDARDLFKVAQRSCADLGLQMVYGDARHWLLRADPWADLSTSTPDAACGHNIDIWSPKGPQALAWRKLQNEIQMEWFIDPVQERREQRQRKHVNGLWLWSGRQINTSSLLDTPINEPDSAAELLASTHDESVLVILDQLNSAALAGDWASWAETFQQLDQVWFKPLCAALQAGQLRQLDLVLSNSNSLLVARTNRSSLRRFWRGVNFNALA